ARLAAVAAAEGGGDLLGDLEAIGAVGADGTGRASAGPADAIEAVPDHAIAIGEAAAAMFVGDTLDGRALVADAAHHQPAGDFVALAGADGAEIVGEAGALDHEALDLSVTFDRDGHGEEVEIDHLLLVRRDGGEFAKVHHRFAGARLE